MGSYKTTLATALVRESALDGIPVYSNYKIDLPNCQRLELSELLQLGAIKAGVIVVDEVYTVADSRISSSKLNRYFSYFVFQTRKLNVDVVYTAQLDSAVDLRLFLLTPFKIACYGLDEKTGTVNYDFVVNKDISAVGIPHSFFKKEIFPVFDTSEVVNPAGLLDLIVDMEKYNPEKFNKRIDEAVLQVMGVKEWPDPKYVFKYEVSDWMVRLGLPESLASYVTNRLKVELFRKKWQGTKDRIKHSWPGR